MKPLLLLVLLSGLSIAAVAGEEGKTIRICDDTGCSQRPIDTETFRPASTTDAEAERRIGALTDAASKDPRAAYDLGLRYFRGDGVRQDSYQALKWMRDAAERGDLQAQKAVGRLYLSGLEEMGSDPQEAEKWLSIAAGRGDKEAAELLKEASAAKKSDAEYRRWVKLRREELYGYWYRGWPYRAYWRGGAWLYY